MAKTKWRVPIGGTRMFSTFERALRRAREFVKKTGKPIDVIEVDPQGNETPVATAQPKAVPAVQMLCPTCGNSDPNDWSRCKGPVCPIMESPYHISKMRPEGETAR